jgi:hypothetical protein
MRGSFVVGLLVAATLSAACTNVPRQFAQDSRLTILSPAAMSIVEPPVAVRWVVSGPRASGTRYAVFVDTLPMRPDAGLRSLVHPRDPCRHIPGCPDETWLRAHGIFLTADNGIVIPVLPVVGGIEGTTDPVVHQVLVVPVDQSGRRVGERVYAVRFRVKTGPAA